MWGSPNFTSPGTSNPQVARVPRGPTGVPQGTTWYPGATPKYPRGSLGHPWGKFKFWQHTNCKLYVCFKLANSVWAQTASTTQCVCVAAYFLYCLLAQTVPTMDDNEWDDEMLGEREQQENNSGAAGGAGAKPKAKAKGRAKGKANADSPGQPVWDDWRESQHTNKS